MTFKLEIRLGRYVPALSYFSCLWMLALVSSLGAEPEEMAMDQADGGIPLFAL